MQEQILSLKSFGARLRVKDGLFEVTVPDLSGAGDHRVEQFAPPTVQNILLHRHTSASADAMLLAEQNGVTLMVLDEHDMPTLLLAGLMPAGSIEIWKQQILLHNTPKGLEFAREWLCLKLQRQLKWLAKLARYRLFDFIEPYRPWMDKIVFNLCVAKEVKAQHVREVPGGVWLSDEGKKMLISTVEEQFREKKEIRNEKNFDLWQTMELDARAFVRMMLPREKDTTELESVPPATEI